LRDDLERRDAGSVLQNSIRNLRNLVPRKLGQITGIGEPGDLEGARRGKAASSDGEGGYKGTREVGLR